ncbi:hypothetical protein ACQ859_28895 [Roseateles chitinivorans]|uniref:hypothetical protein n=1 Tax=Roseateles chitinivorans TaxID=2917965 RepID=UPI003D675A77
MSRPNAPGPRRLLWSRWLVLVLLSLTLPLQGALAATMGIGMALMSSTTGTAVMTMPSDCQDMGHGMAHDMSAMAGMSHDRGGMDHAGMASMDHGMSHDDGADHTATSDHHCGICLQCCIGAALPIASLTPAAQDLRDAAPSLDAHGAPEQSPQPLERPPKAFLA